MRNAKILLFSSVIMTALAGSAMLLGTSPSEARHWSVSSLPFHERTTTATL